MMDFDPLTAEIVWRVWGTPVNFNGFRILASLLHRRRSTEVKQTLHDVRLSPSLVRYIYTFWGLLPLTKFWQMQNSLCVQVLRSPILSALYYCTALKKWASTKLRRGTRNGITELSQRAPPIFGRAAITLGIGPHSSCCFGLQISSSINNLLELSHCWDGQSWKPKFKKSNTAPLGRDLHFRRLIRTPVA